MHESTLVFEYESADRATLLERSLTQELGDIGGDRTTTSISRDGAILTIVIEASDLLALRAGHNTWFGLVEVAERTATLG